MVNVCCVASCRKRANNVKYHRFPYKEEQIYNRWVAATGRSDLKEMDCVKVYKNYRICDKHFPPEVKIDPTKYFSKSQLIKGACPTLFLPVQCGVDAGMSLPEQSTPTPSTSTEYQPSLEIPEIAQNTPERKQVQKNMKMFSKRADLKKRVNFLKLVNVTRSSQLTPKAKCLYGFARRLKKMATALQDENVSLKERLAEASRSVEAEEYFQGKVNNATLNFLLSQIKQQKKEPKGRRYTLDDKVFALSLMKQSLKGYKLLQKVFALPSRKTLNKLLRKIPFHCGVNAAIFNSLKNSAKTLSKMDKYAVLMWDEIYLSSALVYNEAHDVIEGFENNGEKRRLKLADHAMVFMLRGVCKKWKQPVAYFFSEAAMSSADLQRNIKIIVRAARQAGIKIVATVSDQLGINCSAVNALKNDTTRWCSQNGIEDRYFGYVIDGEEIVHIYDPPHLLKGMRNALLASDIKFKYKQEQYQVASWKDVIHFYEQDCRNEDDYKLCSRLTDEHIYKDSMKPMKVKLAAQVFSQRVAATMNSFGKQGNGRTPKSYEETSKFLLFMDKLFDSVNGSTFYPVDGKSLRCAISKESPHIAFWDEAIHVLESIRVLKPKGETTTPSIKNWCYTLRAMKYLWEKLSKDGVKFLLPRNINQDSLENFFGSIRSHGVRNINPTPTGFKNSFKSLLVNNLTATHSPGANCEVDEDSVLNSLRHFLQQTGTDEDSIMPLEPECLEDENFHFSSRPQKFFKNQLHCYLAGYIAKKILRKLKCNTCRDNIVAPLEECENQSYIRERSYNPRSLIYSKTTFRKLFTKSCEIVHYFLPRFCLEKNIGHRLKLTIIRHLRDKFTFTCKEHDVFRMFNDIFVKFYIFTWTSNVNKILKGKEFKKKDINDCVKKLARDKYLKGKSKDLKLKKMKKLA